MLPSIPTFLSTHVASDVVVHQRYGSAWVLLGAVALLALMAYGFRSSPHAVSGWLASGLLCVFLALQARMPRRVVVYLATGRVLVEGGRWFQRRRRMLEPRSFDTVSSYTEPDRDGAGQGMQVVALLSAAVPHHQLVIATYAPHHRRGEASEHPDAFALRRRLIDSGFFRDGGFQVDLRPYPAADIF